jgi:hypothetical protein
VNGKERQQAAIANGSVARQRREAAAALALLLTQKADGLDIAVANREDDHTMRLATEIAILQQDNLRFIIMALQHYAGSLRRLPGKLGKLDRPETAVHQE